MPTEPFNRVSCLHIDKRKAHLITTLPGWAPFHDTWTLPCRLRPSIASPSTRMSEMAGIPLPVSASYGLFKESSAEVYYSLAIRTQTPL